MNEINSSNEVTFFTRGNISLVALSFTALGILSYFTSLIKYGYENCRGEHGYCEGPYFNIFSLGVTIVLILFITTAVICLYNILLKIDDCDKDIHTWLYRLYACFGYGTFLLCLMIAGKLTAGSGDKGPLVQTLSLSFMLFSCFVLLFLFRYPKAGGVRKLEDYVKQVSVMGKISIMTGVTLLASVTAYESTLLARLDESSYSQVPLYTKSFFPFVIIMLVLGAIGYFSNSVAYLDLESRKRLLGESVPPVIHEENITVDEGVEQLKELNEKISRLENKIESSRLLNWLLK